MKTQKGITLIALIITIIVMLILVGVSVSVALNTGLFKTAQGTAKNTEAEKIREQELSSGAIIDKTLIQIGAKEPTIGAIEGLAVGDIVYYDEDGNGTNDEDEKYVVMYNDATYGCQIISVALKDEVTLKATSTEPGNGVTDGYRKEVKAIYNNLVEILNTEAQKYLNNEYGAYARSLGCNPMYGTMKLDKAISTYDSDFIDLSGRLEGATPEYDENFYKEWKTIDSSYSIDMGIIDGEFFTSKCSFFEFWNLQSDEEGMTRCWAASRNARGLGFSDFTPFTLSGCVVESVSTGSGEQYFSNVALIYDFYAAEDSWEEAISQSINFKPVITLLGNVSRGAGDGTLAVPYTLEN